MLSTHMRHQIYVSSQRPPACGVTLLSCHKLAGHEAAASLVAAAKCEAVTSACPVAASGSGRASSTWHNDLEAQVCVCHTG